MKTKELTIGGIPSLIQGEPGQKLFVAVHGNFSSKNDPVIQILAEEAAPKGFAVLSFDLPGHGQREKGPCKISQCAKDLAAVLDYAKGFSGEISVFGCSMGAFTSLLTCGAYDVCQCLFLSPVTDMMRLIRGSMAWAGITEAQLEAEKEIAPENGPMLFWDDYSYIKAHPIETWTIPTSILNGELDAISAPESVADFAKRFGCNLRTMPGGEHYFHTPSELDYYRQWLKEGLK